MKILLIIMGVLTIMTVVYAYKQERADQFKDGMAKCSELFGEARTKPTVDTLYCALMRLGIFDKDGNYLKKEGLQSVEDVIRDPYRARLGQALVHICYDKANQDEGTSLEHTMKLLECSLPITYLIEILN